MGVKFADFWHLTPHTLQLIASGYDMAYKRQLERENAMAHLQGMYFSEALMATVGNMLSGKTARKHEYPDKPYDLNLDNSKQEQENERKLKLFAAQLTTRMNNFNLSKEQGQS